MIYKLNFGPHHPSTHGVLRLELEMDGERIVSCNPDIGYLHRGIEKILESKSFLTCIPFLERIDYLAPVFHEHAFVMVLEDTLKIFPPERALYIRMIVDELTRIASHMMALGTAAYDIGCLSLLLYSIEQREKILNIFEKVTGSRMHLCYYIPGGVSSDISEEVIAQILVFLDGIEGYLETVRVLTFDNRIFQNRTKGIGVLLKEKVVTHSISGPNLRASGVEFDIRKGYPYALYSDLNFDIVTELDGDCFSRSLVRYREIIQSADIIHQCIDKIPSGCFKDGTFPDKNIAEGNRLFEMKYDYFFCSGMDLPANSFISKNIETPRGEFALTIITSSDTKKAYRFRLRTPSFPHIYVLKTIVPGGTIADLTSIVASLDFILSDSDR